MSGRQLARTGARRRQRQPLGHAASRKVHSRAERRRRSASTARFSPTIFGVGLDHCPCAVAKTAGGLPASKPCGRRGRGETPCCSARPYGGDEEQDNRQALGPDETRGDGARPDSCSPDGAKRLGKNFSSGRGEAEAEDCGFWSGRPVEKKAVDEAQALKQQMGALVQSFCQACDEAVEAKNAQQACEVVRGPSGSIRRAPS